MNGLYGYTLPLQLLLKFLQWQPKLPQKSLSTSKPGAGSLPRMAMALAKRAVSD